MSFLDVVFVYWTNRFTLLTLAVLYGILIFFLLFSWFERRRPRVRSRILISAFMVSLLNWTFLASSLVLCGATISLYEAEGYGAVRTILGVALTSSIGIATGIALFVTKKVPSIITRRLISRTLEANPATGFIFEKTSRSLGLNGVGLAESESQLPMAYSVSGKENLVIITRGLVHLLCPDEIETVMAHELAHVKNDDTKIRTLISAYSKMLFFDPVIRMIDKEFYKARELLADEISSEVTRKPLSLASALLKIASQNSNQSQVSSPSLLIGDRHPLSSFLKERVERLRKLAEGMHLSALPDFQSSLT